MTGSRIRMGMIGGGDYSLIGNTHRLAAKLSGDMEIISGVFSSQPDTSRRFAAHLGMDTDRSYNDWEDMLDKELSRPPEERLDGVIIVTPNHLHYPIGKAFAEAGFHVVMDKPMVHTEKQAQDLVKIAEENKVVFAVTYNYTGFPMVKKARDLIASGEIGKIYKVVTEYSQGWLTQPLERQGVKKAEWRTDPDRSGLAGTVADIGSHAENLSTTVTGLSMEEICADLTTLVPGRKLDDDGNILIHYRGGARGVIVTSQVCCGEDNYLRLKVYGEKGGIVWGLGNPDVLEVRGEDGSRQYHHSPDPEYHGHEGVTPSNLNAFTSIYKEVSKHILAVKEGKASAPYPIGTIGTGTIDTIGFDYPTVVDGALGVRFIEKAVTSSQEKAWVSF